MEERAGSEARRTATAAARGDGTEECCNRVDGRVGEHQAASLGSAAVGVHWRGAGWQNGIVNVWIRCEVRGK